MKKVMNKIASKISSKLLSLYYVLYKTKNDTYYDRDYYLTKWYKDNGDKTLRLEYSSLNQESVVFDLGGYLGQWSNDIYTKYCCVIHIFEPVEKFAQKIESRFFDNPKVFIHKFGLASRDEEVFISIDEYNSSISRNVGNNTSQVKLKRATTFIEDIKINQIDLMKVNIEGAEYDLLEHLLASDSIKLIQNIQIQFHNFVPNAESKMAEIHRKLSATHHLTWQYTFVWENWQRNETIT